MMSAMKPILILKVDKYFSDMGDMEGYRKLRTKEDLVSIFFHIFFRVDKILSSNILTSFISYAYAPISSFAIIFVAYL